MTKKRKRGANGEPWMRTETGGWYVKLDGQKTPLRDRTGNIFKGKEREKEAHDAWHRMMAVAQAPVNKDDNRLAIILDLYLQWLEETASGETLKARLSYFKSFNEKWPNLLVSELQPRHLREWWNDCHPNWSDSTRNYTVGAVSVNEKWLAEGTTGDLTAAPMLGILGESFRVQVHEGDLKCAGLYASSGDGFTDPPTFEVSPVLKRLAFMDYAITTPQGELAETGRSVWLGGDYWGTQEAAMQAVVS
jgi:hypothetical protein